MRCWTDGETHVLLGPDGLVVVRDGAASRLGAVALPDGFVRGALAVGAGARILFASAGITGTLYWPGAIGATSRGVQPSALAFLDETSVVAAAGRGDGRGRAYGLAVRSLDSIRDQRTGPPEWDAYARHLALPEPRRAHWPAPDRPGRVFVRPRWAERRRPSQYWTMSASAWGVVAVDQNTGAVFVLRPGEVEVSFALRVPVGLPETAIDAVATERGVLVSYGGGRGAGGVNHFAADGAHLGGVTVRGASAPVTASRSYGLLAAEAGDGSSNLELVWLALEPLGVTGTLATDLAATRGYATVHVSDDGRTALAGDGASARVVRRAASGAWSYAPVVAPARPATSRPDAASAPAAPTGPAPARLVRHRTFGVGTVVNERGEGAARKLDIDFATTGRKTLSASFVEPVEPVERGGERG
jgi:hypothetical protein